MNDIIKLAYILIRETEEAKATMLKRRLTIKEVIKQKDIPLDKRWDIFIAEQYILDTHSYVQHLKTLESNDVSYYDDFYIDKYKTALWINIIENIEEDKEESKFYPYLDQIKEEILEQGYKGFIYDW